MRFLIKKLYYIVEILVVKKYIVQYTMNLNLSIKTVLGILHSERMKRIRQIGLGEFARSISLDN